MKTGKNERGVRKAEAGMEETGETPVPPSSSERGLYEVLVDWLELDGCIVYRTARVRLTLAEAEVVNTHQPGSLRFAGL